MNLDTESAECIHSMCAACQYEDCACECHGPDEEEPFYDPDENTTIEESGYA